MTQRVPDIFWIDDQYYRLVSIIQPLLDRGFTFQGVETYAEALQTLDTIRQSKLLIVDLIIKPGDLPIDLQQHPYLGLELLEQFDANNVHVPIVIFTVVREEELLARARRVHGVIYIVKKGEKDREFIQLAEQILQVARQNKSKHTSGRG